MYTLVWHRSVLEETIQLRKELSPHEYESIKKGISEMESKLRIDPFGLGESRGNRQRIIFSPPLGAIYEVERQKQIVSVLRIWRFRRK